MLKPGDMVRLTASKSMIWATTTVSKIKDDLFVVSDVDKDCPYGTLTILHPPTGLMVVCFHDEVQEVITL